MALKFKNLTDDESLMLKNYVRKLIAEDLLDSQEEVVIATIAGNLIRGVKPPPGSAVKYGQISSRHIHQNLTAAVL